MALKGQQQLIKGPNKRLRKRKLLYIVHTYTTATTRVYVTIEFSDERGGMRNLAYIGATVLNFCLAWPA